MLSRRGVPVAQKWRLTSWHHAFWAWGASGTEVDCQAGIMLSSGTEVDCQADIMLSSGTEVATAKLASCFPCVGCQWYRSGDCQAGIVLSGRGVPVAQKWTAKLTSCFPVAQKWRLPSWHHAFRAWGASGTEVETAKLASCFPSSKNNSFTDDLILGTT